MERPYILHMFTPGWRMSPSTSTWPPTPAIEVIVPYGDVDADSIAGLAQDTIFSRSPKGLLRTAIFIGGRDAIEAADLLKRAKASMFKPFQVSLMADPSGAYTTAAAMVACVESALGRHHKLELKGQRVVVLGGTGPVGRIAGVIAAQAGAEVLSLSRRRGGVAAAEEAARKTGDCFGVAMQGVSGADAASVRDSIAHADVLAACAAAGVQVVPVEALGAVQRLKVAADVNAVPPQGIAGVDAMDDGKPLAGTGAVGIGALAIGNVKYQTQHRLLVQMHDAEAPVVLSFAEAFATARAFIAEKAA